MKLNPLTFFDLITYRIEEFFSAQWVGEVSELFRSILFVSIFQSINLLTLLNIAVIIVSELHINSKVFLLSAFLLVLTYNLLRYYFIQPRKEKKVRRKDSNNDLEGRVTIGYIISSVVLFVASLLIGI